MHVTKSTTTGSSYISLLPLSLIEQTDDDALLIILYRLLYPNNFPLFCKIMAITPAREVEFNFDRFYNVIDGNLETTPSTRRGVNPSTLQPNPEVPVASKNDVDRAIQGARKGFQTWSKVPIDERRLAIIAFSKSIAEHRNEFVKMLITEQGKPFVQAASEVDASVKWLTDQASLSLPDEIVEDTDERKVVTTFPPLGVAALIVPWNCRSANVACTYDEGSR
jgi:hypothetical protein